MLNKQGEGKIDWCDYTWNPISGCKHNCSYCYMLRLVEKNNYNFTPQYHPNRLNDIKNIQNPSKIFVGSSGDMFGEWVDKRHIQSVLDVIRDYPQHTFQFLTKNPKGYYGHKYRENCWLGVTIDTMQRMKNVLDCGFPNMMAEKQFCSFEPLLEKIDIDFTRMPFDWIIIGANSNRGATPPKREWADLIIKRAREHNIPIWIKDNLKYPERIKEFPTISCEAID